MPMLEDARWAEDLLDKEDNQFTRRTYNRGAVPLSFKDKKEEDLSRFRGDFVVFQDRTIGREIIF